MEEIVNKVTTRKLKTYDLEDFYPKGKRIVFDISKYLYKGLILKEKDFRQQLEEHDWSKYQDNYVALTCTSDAIIPSWAYLLLSTKLHGIAKRVVTGNLELLETIIFFEIIEQLDVSDCEGLPVIIKGCSNKPIPNSAYNFLINKVQTLAKSLMFGEACSVVPLYKNKLKKE